MVRRRAIAEIGSVIWAIVGWVVALPAISHANPDARWLVGIASVFFPLCAVGGAMALRSGRDRLAGLLLLISVATPTYFAYVLNLPALFVGVTLLLVPSPIVGDPDRP